MLSRVGLSCSFTRSVEASRSPQPPTFTWRSQGSRAAAVPSLPGSHNSFALAPRRVQAHAVKQAANEEGSSTEALQLIADLSRAVDTHVSQVVSGNVQAGQALAELAHTSPLRSRVLSSISRVSQGLLERDTEVTK
jgi:hypothetical protein